MLFECDGRYPFDLIILDIQMKKQNGMELARRIRPVSYTPLDVYKRQVKAWEPFSEMI